MGWMKSFLVAQTMSTVSLRIHKPGDRARNASFGPAQGRRLKRPVAKPESEAASARQWNLQHVTKLARWVNSSLLSPALFRAKSRLQGALGLIWLK